MASDTEQCSPVMADDARPLPGAENPRLQLAPVRAFNAFLLESFAAGACTCLRCRETERVQAHTFEINGTAYRRRFALTSDTDVMAALEAGWKSFFKTAMPTTGVVDLSEIQQFTDKAGRPFLGVLLVAAQCVHEKDGALVFGRDPGAQGTQSIDQLTAKVIAMLQNDGATAPVSESIPAPAAPEPEQSAAEPIDLGLAEPMDIAAELPVSSSPARSQPMQATLDLFDGL